MADESGPRVAIVTGAGRGIGLATARRLLAGGYAVAVVDVNERGLTTAESELGESARVLTIMASVTNREEMSGAVRRCLERWGRVDVLVNNAAINKPGGLLDQRDEDWAAVLEVNLTGAFLASAAVAGAMKAQGSGTIISIGSIGGAGFGGSPAYAASKAGLVGLTKNMARELGPFGITANLIAPGVIATEWVERNLGEESMRRTAESTPLRRVGSPEDIAGIVAFLASEDARHITGQVISASGGYWMP